jgi:hypothetical protein
MAKGLRRVAGGPASPPYSKGPYMWTEQVTFSGGVAGVNRNGKVYYVDGTNGADGYDGQSWSTAKATVQAAIDLCTQNDTVFIAPLEVDAGATDPGSYEENIVIGADNCGLALVGCGTGKTQGGLPQIKVGATTTNPIITVRAPNCVIAGLGINGAGATGGGVLLDDDSSTKSAYGTTIVGCHFKNCKGTDATGGETGGAIQWAAAGNAWQVLISGNTFYKNVCDITLMGTSSSVPQDVVIENNVFSGPAANVDCNLYLSGGSGMNGVSILNNVFPCMPALSGANNARAISATGCVGILAGNYFGFPTQGAGIKTTGAAGTGNLIPTTVIIAGNTGEADTEGDTGYVFRS